VPLLRRTTAPVAGPDEASGEVAAPEDPTFTPGKGRPTPKRKEARQTRRQPVPKTRKEAERLRRERNREQRRVQRQALLTGDERNLPARDRGPARRLARDMVDSRFTLGQFALIMILVLFVLSTTPNVVVGLIVRLLLLVLTVATIGQGWLTAREVRRRVESEHGLAAARGVQGYAFWRSLSARRMRRPPPQVKRGDTV
jgi:hypothetical protein